MARRHCFAAIWLQKRVVVASVGVLLAPTKGWAAGGNIFNFTAILVQKNVIDKTYLVLVYRCGIRCDPIFYQDDPVKAFQAWKRALFYRNFYRLQEYPV